MSTGEWRQHHRREWQRRQTHMVHLRYLCLFSHCGIQHILCCIFCFVCLHPVSCVWWCPTHIMFYFLPCLSSSRVLCMMVSSIYCVVFFALYFFIPCFVYDGVQHILCCIFCFVVIPCLVYDGVQHILCCVFCFVCLRLMSCVSNVASFSGLSILDHPFDNFNV